MRLGSELGYLHQTSDNAFEPALYILMIERSSLFLNDCMKEILLVLVYTLIDNFTGVATILYKSYL